MTRHFATDTAALLGRSLRHIGRSPDTIMTTAVMPIIMLLLFVYVFGGAIQAGTDTYVNYLLPGILLVTIASGVGYTAYRLFLDRQGGIFERFRSMPIAPSSVLWAHVLTTVLATLTSVAVVVGVALLVGFRSSAGVLAWLEALGILALFTLALTWLTVTPGLTATSADGATAVSYTHLDVYKRQGWARPSPPSRRRAPGRAAARRRRRGAATQPRGPTTCLRR